MDWLMEQQGQWQTPARGDSMKVGKSWQREDDDFEYQMAYGTPFMAASQGGNPPMLEEERDVIPVVNDDKVNRDVKIVKTT